MGVDIPAKSSYGSTQHTRECVLPCGIAHTQHYRATVGAPAPEAENGPLGSPPRFAHFSRAYLRHLITTKNLLGARLLSLHNLAFYMQLLGEMRTAIAQDRFDVWRREWSVHYAAPTSDATESAA